MKLVCTNCNALYDVEYREPDDSGYCPVCDEEASPYNETKAIRIIES